MKTFIVASDENYHIFKIAVFRFYFLGIVQRSTDYVQEQTHLHLKYFESNIEIFKSQLHCKREIGFVFIKDCSCIHLSQNRD